MTLHKYTKAGHGLSYLRTGFLRFSPLSVLNDPFEMNPYIAALGTPDYENATMDEVEAINGPFPPGVLNDALRWMHGSGLDLMREQMIAACKTVGILCLTHERRDDLLLWAHYADSHRGCVLEFDASHDWFGGKHGSNSHPLLGVLQEVRYSPTRPTGSLEDLERQHFLTKADCWSYERERRILLNLSDCSTKSCDGREVNGLFQVPLEALMNVYLGANINSEDRDKFLAILSPGHRVGLFQFRLDERDFALVARQLN